MSLFLIALRSALILALFLGILPLLQKRTSFKFQRIFLITGLISGILPWLAHFFPANQLYVAVLEPVLISGEAMVSQLDSRFDFSSYLWPAYWAGVVASLSLLMREMLQLRRLFRGAQIVRQGRMTLVYTRHQQHSIFSWWHFLFIPKSQAEAGISDAILQHELEHIRAGHSMDKLLMQLFIALQWFNPLVYFYRIALRDLHEFEADQAAIQKTNKSNYATTLLAQAFHTPDFVMVNQLVNHSTQLKKRLKMMQNTSNRSLGRPLAYAVLALAVVFSTLTAFAGNPIDKRLKQLAQLESLSDSVVTAADKMPVYKGGNEALLSFMSKNVVYPEAAKKDSIQGIVVMTFVVGKDGNVSQLSVKRSVHPLLDEAALAALRKMDKWTPGEIQGKKVNVEMALPIKFSLK